MPCPTGRTTAGTQRLVVALQVFFLVAALVLPAAAMASDPPPDPSGDPGGAPSAEPTPEPTPEPTGEPTAEPTPEPTAEPTAEPTPEPTPEPTVEPTGETTSEPTAAPTTDPSPSAPVASPTIASDLDDYPPGGLVTLTGTGWQPGESVHIYVNDDWGSTWSRHVDVIADADGHIHDQFTLPDWFVALYTVVATGSQSGAATDTFTDGAVRVRARVGTTNIAASFAANSVDVFANSDCSGLATSEWPATGFSTTTGGNGYASVTGLSVSSVRSQQPHNPS